VLEATILATRLHLYDVKTVAETIARYDEIIHKTGDEAERTAWQQLRDYVERWTNDHRG
jgi:hypothetical protein